MMSKELKALDAWKTIKRDALYHVQSAHMVGFIRQEEIQKEKKRISIIEKELKDIQEIKTKKYLVAIPRMTNKTSIVDELLTLQTAIKIIKEKQVDMRIFIASAILAEHETPDAYNFTISDVKRHLTQEEYDLLKEVGL